MVVKIQPASSSVGSLLAYNDRKVAAGEADVIFTRGFPDDTPEGRQEIFESLRKLSFRSDKVNFHASINPSVKDKMTKDTVIEFAKELMERLGYGSQPMVIYCHHDIERVHYHVVSSRIGPDGRKIPDDFERRRCQQIMKELSPKYGFSVEPPRKKGSSKQDSQDTSTARNIATQAIAAAFGGDARRRSADEEYDRQVQRSLDEENRTPKL